MLPWLVLLAPLVAAGVILLVTRGSRALSAWISVGAVAVSFVASVALFLGPDLRSSVDWLRLDVLEGISLVVPFGVTVDALSKTMLLVVTGVGLLVHVYSLGYMHGDRGESRYFACLSLFMFSMLGIVLADNFVMMFIFWELVGASSYLLIGHWFERPSAAEASKKAFLMNRLGDFGFMIGILLIWGMFGTVVFADLPGGIERLVGGVDAMRLTDPVQAATLSKRLTSFLTLAVLGIFCGAVGKSAQMPLHTWLPDAMEGPTPVSALIHAATMVAAGVYMLVRVSFLLPFAPNAMTVIAWVGIITAFLAALMAVQQDDIKRVLAYSTLSQLGYMVSAVGLAASGAAMFHLFTHAFFKALLFLAAGSIIHGMHHEQDIWQMGGLKNKQVITFFTFLVGALALAGLPYLTSGFYSKDAILYAAAGKSLPIFVLGLITAFLTAFYMTRLFLAVFFGKPRSEKAKVAHESPLVMWLPLVILAVPSVIFGFPFITSAFHLEAGHHDAGAIPVPMLAALAFLLGVGNGVWIYARREHDPIRINLLARKFYFDEIYAGLVRVTQDLAARLAGFLDRYLIDGLLVRGASALTFGAGFVLRFFQVGSAQSYAMVFALGAVLLLWVALR